MPWPTRGCCGVGEIYNNNYYYYGGRDSANDTVTCYGLHGVGFETGGRQIFRILDQFGGPPSPCTVGTVQVSQELDG
jgi:hypothetical protein